MDLSSISETTVSADRAPGPRFRSRRPGGSSAGFGTARSGRSSRGYARMAKTTEQNNIRNPQAGITLIETMLAALILVIGSIGMLSLIVDPIATNKRNKMDSTQTMLAGSILEQIHSRSEERRVGEEGRSRWWADHLKKKKIIKRDSVQVLRKR